MNKKDKKITDRHSTLILSVLINVIIMVIIVLLFNPSFETNDDMAISNIVDGSKGTYDFHLIFINCMIGYLLKWLYMTFAVVPWYAVLQYVIIFSSLTSLTYVMWDRIKAPYCRCAFLAVLTWFAYEAYILIQFSRTASIATIAGVILLLSNLFSRKLSVWRLVFGYILAILGSFYRMELCLAVTVLLSGIGVYFVLQLTDWKRGIFRAFAIFAGLFVLIFGFYRWDRSHYQSAEWKYYSEVFQLRSELWDYGFPDYEENKEQFEETGVDKTTLAMLKQWVQLDQEHITKDTLQGLVDLKPVKKLDSDFWIGYLRTILFNAYRIPACLLFLYVGIIWLFYNKRKWVEVVTVVYEVLLILGEYFYLYYKGRYFLNRVDMGLWMAVIMVIFWMLNQKNDEFSKRAGMASSLAVIMLGLYIVYPNFRVNVSDPSKDRQKSTMIEQLKEISEDKDHLYVMKPLVLNLSDCFGPFDRVPEGLIENRAMLGGWPSGSSSENDILEKNHVSNPLKEIANSNKIYIVDNNIASTIAYIRKWYAPEATEELEKQLDGCAIYQIVE